MKISIRFFFLLVLFTFTFTTAANLADEPFIIAIAGGSASGKTFVAKRLVELLGSENAILYSMDHYFAPEKQAEEFYLKGSINYDHPSAVDLEELTKDLQQLKMGKTIYKKQYTYGKPVEKHSFVKTESRKFIILEGLYVLHPSFDPHTDLKVFVDVDTETRLLRRLKRDSEEGRSDLGGAEKYFLDLVEPMHQLHIQPTAQKAHIIIDSPSDIQILDQRLQRLLGLIDQHLSFKKCEKLLFKK